MTKKALTAESVRRLNAPSSGRLEIGDLAVPGLVLRVTERGVKSWAVLYRVLGEGGVTASGLLRKGRQKRLTLGRYPIIDLAVAREKARAAIRLATEGRDPATELRTEISARHVRTIDWAIAEFGKLKTMAIPSGLSSACSC
jgi:Arm DNA-binding domain